MSTRTNFTLFLTAILVTSCAPKSIATPSEAAFVTKTPLSVQAVIPSSTSEPKPTPTHIHPIIISLNQGTDYHTEVTYPPCESGSYIPTPNAGCRFTIHTINSSTQIDLGNSFLVKVLTPIDDNKSLVTIIRDDKEVYKTKIQRYTFSGLVAAWGYENHWIIEVTTSDWLDIIQDGESLKAKNGYDEVCGFQILSGKPFYFFKKSGYGYGVNYGGTERHLDYDDIVCSAENPNVDPLIIHYQNVVYFAVKQNGTWKTAIIESLKP